jgi:leader peptidase (prepilin peptidase)/N-methyltransferase
MFLEVATHVGLFMPGLLVLLGGAALGGWCVGFACRYACLLDNFFSFVTVGAGNAPIRPGSENTGLEDAGSRNRASESTGPGHAGRPVQCPSQAVATDVPPVAGTARRPVRSADPFNPSNPSNPPDFSNPPDPSDPSDPSGFGDGEGYSLLIQALAWQNPSAARRLQRGGRALKYGGAALMAPVVFVLWQKCGFGLAFWAMSAGTALLLILAIVDAKTMLLPDTLTLPLLWLGLALAWVGGRIPLHDAVAGAMAGYLFLWLLFWLFKYASRREGMGYGDFKLFAALGAWVGWSDLPQVLLAACLGGILFACLSQKSILPRGAYPFGPFLALGGVGALSLESGVQSYFG